MWIFQEEIMSSPPAFLLNLIGTEEVVVDVGILTLKFSN